MDSKTKNVCVCVCADRKLCLVQGFFYCGCTSITEITEALFILGLTIGSKVD